MESNPIGESEIKVDMHENPAAMEAESIEQCFEEIPISSKDQGLVLDSSASSSSSSGVSSAEGNDSLEAKLEQEGMKMVQFTAKKKRLPGKVRNRQKDLYLRRKLAPKSPHMAINELKEITIKDYNVRNEGDKFIAKAIINSKPYVVEADSKSAAANLLFENALREYYVAKAVAKPNPVSPDKKDDHDGDSNKHDEFPMRNLVSLALYKLFAEWTSKGYAIPELNPGGSKETNEEPQEKKVLKNWAEKHPVTMLNQLFPLVHMNSETSICPDGATMVHQMSLTLNGANFKASASNKKMAKRRLAIMVCNQLAGTNYTE
ncbi:hypothetical protein KR067_007961 [Drosophila pandora]|nr:hypothetical protein KR067_007961 [Drosophila pandora]